MSQFCARCQGLMLGDTPRAILNGKVLHIYFHWKLTVGSQPREAPPLINLIGERNENPLQQDRRGSSGVHAVGNTDSPSDSESDILGKPRRLHWTSNQ